MTDNHDESIDWRVRTIHDASSIRAFNEATFDDTDGSGDLGRLAAGALIVATTIVIDELFMDIEMLAVGGDTAPGDRRDFLVLADLPERFASRYDARFARSFLVATVAVTARLSLDCWSAPASVGEALALSLVVERARNLLVEHEIVDAEAAGELYKGFEDAAFDDLDHQWLYHPQSDGVVNTFGAAASDVIAWFEQNEEADGCIHPYSTAQ
ncbi:hypothetical protein [Paractinoplanes toevensis]|uniref:Uncharacterized protein n=1 Tax=Paractinoplanes toevensis TaxID=571911 RepID=A0A919TDE2_9ACTN|nr:hypothetical protein [Actinoplanes toevensis]GIM93042.1 hypothetical protein Ato02nite_048350 [Actinoplanes toevensis]